MRRTLSLLTLPLMALAACQDRGDLIAPPAAQPDQPVLSQEASSIAQPGRYIVVLRPDVVDVPGVARQLVQTYGGELGFTYQRALKGFSVRALPEAVVESLRQHPRVAYIEPDAEAQLFVTQQNATWGLDRVDQRDLPLSTTYTYDQTGVGVNAYILDTGVRLTHDEFEGRAQYVPNGNNGDFVGDGRGNASDCHGHGTHVAGTVGGKLYGVAKSVNIWAARVVNCSGGGNVSMAIAAVDWITANGTRPAVVNMSLGYGNVQSLRDAVENSVAAGVHYAAAAGNGNLFGIPQDACLQSPAGAPNANTVGATTSSDAESSFSNFGTCVDILAPGSSVTSAWYTSDAATSTISGTSMAAPHVAGALALYLQLNPGASPAAASAALRETASLNKISLHSRSRSNNTPNRLLYTLGFTGGGDPPPNTPPSASFTYSCTNLSCNFNDTSTDSDGSVVGWSWNFGDGNTSTVQNPSHTYAAAGTYTVALTVTDNAGATGTTSQSVTVAAPPGGNQPPVADFTYNCGLGGTCSFTDRSSDPDGSVVAWSWNFGNGNTSTAQNPTNTYSAPGTYTVTQTVTDNGGLTASTSTTIVCQQRLLGLRCG